MVRAGVDPGLLDEVSWWRTDDLWFWGAPSAGDLRTGGRRTQCRARFCYLRKDREPPRRPAPSGDLTRPARTRGWKAHRTSDSTRRPAHRTDDLDRVRSAVVEPGVGGRRRESCPRTTLRRRMQASRAPDRSRPGGFVFDRMLEGIRGGRIELARGGGHCGSGHAVRALDRRRRHPGVAARSSGGRECQDPGHPRPQRDRRLARQGTCSVSVAVLRRASPHLGQAA
jgi:hypothetical protein